MTATLCGYVNCLQRVIRRWHILCLQCSRELLMQTQKIFCVAKKRRKCRGLQPDRMPRWHVHSQCCGQTWVHLEQLLKLQSSSEQRLLLMFLPSIVLDVDTKCWVERLWRGRGFRVSQDIFAIAGWTLRPSNQHTYNVELHKVHCHIIFLMTCDFLG